MRSRLVLGCVVLLSALGARAGERLSAEALLPGHGGTHAHAPVAAFGADVFLLVWEAGRAEKADIVGLRLDRTGKPLDAKPFVISGAEECQERPRIAFGGGNFLVVWQDLRNGKDYDVYAARVSPEGKVLDPDGVAVSALKHNQAQPAVCFDGSAFQLLWRDFRDGKDYDIFGGRVSTAGRPVDGSGVLVQKHFKSYFTTHIDVPGVGANGKGEVLAAVQGTRGTSLVIWPMRGGKVTGKMQSFKVGRKGNAWDPRFASDGEKFLMVFTTMRPVSRGGANPQSGAVLLEANPVIPKDGKPKTPVALSDKPEWGSCVRNPSPAWDGKTYIVAWDAKRSVPRPARDAYDAVSLRRISVDGKPLGVDTEVAGEIASPAYHPAVASDGKGITLVAYERHPKTADVPIRIGFRMLK